MEGFYHSLAPDFFLTEYQGRYYSWNHQNFNKQKHTHIGGAVSFPRTKTSLRIGVDNIKSYTYLATGHELSEAKLQINHWADVLQSSNDVNVVTAELEQNFKAGILNWENRVTYLDVVEKIQNTATASGDRPKTDISMTMEVVQC